MAASDPEELEATLDSLDAVINSRSDDEVLDVVTEMAEAQVELLRTVEKRQQRIDRLEQIATTFGDIDVKGVESPQDQAVLNAIKAGDEREFSLEDLQNLYRSYTDVRRQATLKRRIKTLTENGPFQQVGPQRWLYTGGPHIRPESER